MKTQKVSGGVTVWFEPKDNMAIKAVEGGTMKVRFRDLSFPLKFVTCLAWFWGITQSLIALYYFFLAL